MLWWSKRAEEDLGHTSSQGEMDQMGIRSPCKGEGRGREWVGEGTSEAHPQQLPGKPSAAADGGKCLGG